MLVQLLKKVLLTKFYHFSGKGKGTPMLKNGIRLIEVLPDPNDSEANTDWKGF